MKKLVVSLMALAVISIGVPAVNANPVSDWFHNVGNKITKTENDITQAQKEQEKAAAARKSAYQSSVNEQKTFWNNQKKFWKKVFTFVNAS